MFIALFVTLVAIGAILLVRRFRQPRALILQWGKFENKRLGIKSSKIWEDEPDWVSYTDYKFWIRLKPNPGVNLPLVGYWSKARGRNK